MRGKRLLRQALHSMIDWLESDSRPVPIDNSYEWIGQSFQSLASDPLCRRRPSYVWGVLQGAALAAVLKYPRISVVEFGVAGGAGLLSLERIAERTERLLNIKIDVHGFDSGSGLPALSDYRDMAYLWSAGFFPADLDELQLRLHRAKLHIGLVQETVLAFLDQPHAPVAFISFDLDMYSSTAQSFRMLCSDVDSLLPRIPCYFDDIMGYCSNDFAGERLAIAEFNKTNSSRKIGKDHGLRYFVPYRYRTEIWPEMMFTAHALDHPLYDHPALLKRGTVIDINNAIEFVTT